MSPVDQRVSNEVDRGWFILPIEQAWSIKQCTNRVSRIAISLVLLFAWWYPRQRVAPAPVDDKKPS